MITLLAITLPLWLLAGFGDWLCHRRTSIQRTAGARESAFHLVLYLVIAVPIVLGLFLEVSTTLLVFMVLCVLAHSAVSFWDTSYAQPRRYISPVEQMIHSHKLDLSDPWNFLLLMGSAVEQGTLDAEGDVPTAELIGDLNPLA